MILGITGYAESGKDEVADVLVKKFGFVKLQMSESVDECIQILNPWIYVGQNDISETGWRQPPGYYRYRYICLYLDYVTRKKIQEVRIFLQLMGTDVGRMLDEDLWVKQILKKAANHENVVITGIRYPNEVKPLDRLLLVKRPGYGPKNDHSSESLSPVVAQSDWMIWNDSTLEELRYKTIDLFEMLGYNPSQS